MTLSPLWWLSRPPTLSLSPANALSGGSNLCPVHARISEHRNTISVYQTAALHSPRCLETSIYRVFAAISFILAVLVDARRQNIYSRYLIGYLTHPATVCWSRLPIHSYCHLCHIPASLLHKNSLRNRERLAKFAFANYLLAEFV